MRPSVGAYFRHYWGAVSRPFVRGKKKLTKKFEQRKGQLEKLRRAAHTIVDPFSPFAMADCFLSDEIAVHQLEYINPLAVNLAQTNGHVHGARIVFVQVDQLSEFEERHLSRFSSPFVLVTAKWLLPILEISDSVLRIAESPLVRAWYTRNFESKNPQIKPFPLGVDFWSAPEILKFRNRMRKIRRKRDLYIPLARVHKHLTGLPLQIREMLMPFMEKEVPLKTYLRNLASSMYVIAPPGEKPDTYRKWECLALGATPVIMQSEFLSTLLGPKAVQVDDLTSVANRTTSLPEFGNLPENEIWRFDYWRSLLLAELDPVDAL